MYLKVSKRDDQVGYVYLSNHPGNVYGIVKKQIDLRDLIGDYKGADILLDFNSEGVLIGIEILE